MLRRGTRLPARSDWEITLGSGITTPPPEHEISGRLWTWLSPR